MRRATTSAFFRQGGRFIPTCSNKRATMSGSPARAGGQAIFAQADSSAIPRDVSTTGARSAPPHRGLSDVDYSGNFADFLAERKPGQPFCFWFGGFEPHRDYEEGSGVARARTPGLSRCPLITRIRT